jgi:hypothetical protein
VRERGELVAAGEREQLLRQAGARERALHPGGRARCGGREQHGVAGEQGGGHLQQRPGPGRAVAHVHPDDAERALDERGAPPGAQRRDRPEPLIGELCRAVGREPVQPAHRRQQLGEQRLAARLPRLGGEQVSERLEFVEQGDRGAAQVARAVTRGDERPERLRCGCAVARGHRA